jgi:hypothetical protein
MLTNFIDADGNEQDDCRILIGLDLHNVSIMEMEMFLVNFGNLERFDEHEGITRTATYFMTILFDRESSTADVSCDAKVAQFA